MRTSNDFLEIIAREALSEKDIAEALEKASQGHTLKQILSFLRRKIVTNSKGLRKYIDAEIVLTIILKLSHQINRQLVMVAIRTWLDRKEILIQWGKNLDPELREIADELQTVLGGDRQISRANLLVEGIGAIESVMSKIEAEAERFVKKMSGRRIKLKN